MACRFRGERRRRRTETELSDKADWYQERGQVTKNLVRSIKFVAAQNFVVPKAKATVAAMCLPGGPLRHRTPTQHHCFTSKRAEQEPNVHHFDYTVMRAALVY